jgi:hypothetical protein
MPQYAVKIGGEKACIQSFAVKLSLGKSRRSNDNIRRI